MEVTLDKLSKTEALIKIRISEPDYQSAVQEKIKDYSKKANLKGFRPGKVPQGVIKKMFGKSILVEEVNSLLSQKLQDYIRENDLQVLGDPLPNSEQASSIDWDHQTEFDFEFNLGLAEDFEVKLDKKMKVETYTIKVDDEIIDETVENLQDQMGQMTNPEISEEGDSIFGTLKSQELGIEKDVLLEIAKIESKQQKEFIGKSKDDQISLAFGKTIKDENYALQLTELTLDELKKVKDFNFTVKNVNRMVPAAVDQELFDKTFGKDSVKSVEEFRDRVREVVSNNYSKEEITFEKYAIQKKLSEKTGFELPDEFLKDWLVRSNDGKVTLEDVDKEYSTYANELKWSLIKNKIVKENELKVEHEEVTEEAKKLIRSQLASSGMVGDQFESSLDTFADNYLKGENGDNYMKVYNQTMDQKVIDYIKENITIKTKEISAKEFKDIPLN